MRIGSIGAVIGLLGGLSCIAQSAVPAPAGAVTHEPVLLASEPGIMMGVTIGGINMRGIKGLPYSLVQTTTSQRTLADGTTITNVREERIMRDAEGRERHEAGMMRDGKVEVMSIFVTDPVAHTSIILMPRQKTAVVNHHPEMKTPTPEQEAKEAAFRAKLEADRKNHPVPANGDDLGTQAIAGVVAEGKRHTMVIPAGRMGNDREIKVVTETWTSPELKILVGRTTEDPRTGKSTMVVTDLQRGEPAAALFVVPADYKVEERTLGPAGMVGMSGTAK